MNIGDASAASGVSAKMIRYYEQIGLIRPAARTESGYRVYSPSEVETLRFIRRARDLGFSVEEMGTLLALWQDKARESADVKRVALQHVAEIEKRIVELEGMARTLRHLAGHCHGDERPDCPILDDLATISEMEKGAPARKPALRGRH
jgi:MerR family copper efflux transcriptional regulator